GRRAEARRRRLSDETLRDDRADGAARGAAAPAAVGAASGRRDLSLRRHRRRLPTRRGDARRRRNRSVGARGPAAAGLRPAPRRDAVARRAADRRVGLRRDAAHAHGRRPRRRPAPEDRNQSALARVHPHGPRSRLQVRRVDRWSAATRSAPRCCADAANAAADRRSAARRLPSSAPVSAIEAGSSSRAYAERIPDKFRSAISARSAVAFPAPLTESRTPNGESFAARLLIPCNSREMETRMHVLHTPLVLLAAILQTLPVSAPVTRSDPLLVRAVVD